MSGGRDFEWDYAIDITPGASALDPRPIGLHNSGASDTFTVEFYRGYDAAGGVATTVSADVYIAQGDYVKMDVYKVTAAAGSGQAVGLYRGKRVR